MIRGMNDVTMRNSTNLSRHVGLAVAGDNLYTGLIENILAVKRSPVWPIGIRNQLETWNATVK